MNENLNTNLNEMEDAVYFEEVPVNEVEIVEETQQSPSLGEILVKGVVLGLTALAVKKGTEILIDKVVAPSATTLMGKINQTKLMTLKKLKNQFQKIMLNKFIKKQT